MYNLVVQLLEPYTVLVLSLAAASTWAWRRQRPRSRFLVTVSVLVTVLVVLSMPFVGDLVLGSLEWSYPTTSAVPTPADTIVVLGGNVVLDLARPTRLRLGRSTVQRCHYAAQLYRQAGHCRLLLSGGRIGWSAPIPTEAEAMRDYMLEFGVRPEDIVLEDRSSTTYENALYSKDFLADRGSGRVFLVTEAAHMYRSEGCFRAQGVDVIPAACDHHAWRRNFAPTQFLPTTRGISYVTQAAYEWRGCLWYRLTGRI